MSVARFPRADAAAWLRTTLADSQANKGNFPRGRGLLQQPWFTQECLSNLKLVVSVIPILLITHM